MEMTHAIGSAAARQRALVGRSGRVGMLAIFLGERMIGAGTARDRRDGAAACCW